MKLCWPAPERNKEAILSVLQRVLPQRGRVLELASGSGQHAAFFAARLPALEFQPSDIDPVHVASIHEWVKETGLANLKPPLRIDVLDTDWIAGEVDAVFNANLIHIAPWECAEGMFRGSARHLRAGGVLVSYGPYHIGGAPTAPSNQAFDEELRRRDARFGVRDLEAVSELAQQHGFVLMERAAMPANNQCLVFSLASKNTLAEGE